jgi:hypothetical protein
VERHSKKLSGNRASKGPLRLAQIVEIFCSFKISDNIQTVFTVLGTYGLPHLLMNGARSIVTKLLGY